MTPLERAARALYKRDPLNGTAALPESKIGLGGLPWDAASKHVRDKFMNHARAVLTAIREPSEVMLEVDPLRPDGSFFAEDYWQAMIDAALQEG